MRHGSRRSLVWQSALILLPMLALAALGLVLVERDRASVLQEARETMERTAPPLVRLLGSQLTRQMEDDLRYALQWREEGRQFAADLRIVRGSPQGGAGFEVPIPQFRALVEALPESRRGQLFDGSFGWIMVLDREGQLISPRPFPPFPQPAEWPPLTADERDTVVGQVEPILRGAREGVETDPAPEVVHSSHAALIRRMADEASSRGEDAVALVLHELLAVQENVLVTEAGLPVQPLARLEVARMLGQQPGLMNDAGALAEWRKALDELGTSALLHPSCLSEPIFGFIERETASLEGVPSPKRSIERDLWMTLRATSGFHETLRSAGELAMRGDQAPASRWVRWKDEDWWVGFLPEHPQADGPREPSATGVFPFSRRSLELAILELLDLSEAILPDGLDIRVAIDGRLVIDPAPHAGVIAVATGEILAGGPVAYSNFDGWFQELSLGNVTIEIVIARPGVLLALQRQRSLWLFSVIGGALAVSVTGLAMIWRTHLRQLALNEMKSNFVSSVSHELRAPIASVRLMAENLEQGRAPGEAKLREYVGFIGQECRRLSSLIENVLDFSRIEQGRKRYDREPTDLTRLVTETVRLMEPYATERDVKLVLHPEGRVHPPDRPAGESGASACAPGHRNVAAPIELDVDGRAIQQALINLIDNAIKHSPAGAVVEVTIALSGRARLLPSPDQVENAETSADADHSRLGGSLALPGTGGMPVLLSVTDHGPGIPGEEHEKIFERFYRRGSELRRETRGIGIGLSIVKHIVEGHGGRVWVESEPGKGSRFVIELKTDQLTQADER